MTPMPQPLRLKTKEDDLTWVQKLKKLEKKDVAAVGVCLMLLGVLPVIEQVLTNGGEEGKLQQGFAVPGSGPGTGESGDSYEPGVGPGAPGGVPGQSGGEVITPMAGRDPTSLVMGMGGQPVKAPGGGSDRDKPMRDALADSMRRAMPEVTRSAANPVPTAKLSTSLANLLGGGGGGGSGASAAGLKGGADILASAKGEPGRSTPHGVSYSGSSAPGYAGPAQKRGISSTGGDGERQKAAADAAAAKFNKAGAIEGLGDAAKASSLIGGDTPGSGGGGPGQDEAAKKAGPGASTSKGDRNFGESQDQQRSQKIWEKEFENCNKRKEGYATSFSGGLWALTTHSADKEGNKGKGNLNLFSKNVDCNDIPDWVSGPIGKMMDSVFDQSVGAFSKDFLKFKVEGWMDKVNPTAKKVAYIGWDCSTVVASLEKVSCGPCGPDAPAKSEPCRGVQMAIGSCAYESVTTKTGGKKEEQVDNKTKGIAYGFACHKLQPDSDEDKAKKAAEERALHGSGGAVDLNMKNLKELKEQERRGGTPVDPRLVNSVDDTTGALDKARIVVAQIAKTLPQKYKEMLAAKDGAEVIEKELRKHCSQGGSDDPKKDSGHVERLLMQAGNDQALGDRHLSACVKSHVSTSQSHGGIAGKYVAALEYEKKAAGRWLKATQAAEDCTAVINKIGDNPASIQMIGDKKFVVADPKDLALLNIVCTVPKEE